ncbi:MAG: adenylate/guanylate cyclase domain-containing protein [Saprospiraceae bacterium]|nr:adenylate/guanylate cyclase domain-containing protein [Saprospiraceae bacterium]
MNRFFRGQLGIKLRLVAWIAVAWTLMGLLDALNTHALAKSLYMHPTEVYRFKQSLWFSAISAFFAGLLSGSVLLFFLRERVRTKSFGFAILINSLVLSTLNFGITTISYDLFLSLRSGMGPLSPPILQEASALLHSSIYYRSLVFWSLVVFLTIVFLHVNEKYGTGVFFNLLMGRYHKPREEERIFMFVDMKSSTLIAERLGHIRFFNLLNDFFRDITDPVSDAGGEIYQYVGDEVVISWPIERGLTQANCIRCFYGMREAILKQSQRYREKYGLVPDFKAGLHCGMVTIGEIGVIKKDIVFSGDVLNTTSRIQDVCNRYDVRILLSKYLLDKLHLPPHSMQFMRVGIIELKGKRQKVELFTIEDSDKPAKEGRVWPLVDEEDWVRDDY